LTLPGTINIQITGTSINLAANSSYVNSTSLRIFNLNTSSSNIPPQNITIRINDLVQPSSVKNISPFNVLIYYSSANDLVAQANTSNVISTTPGSITTASVTPSSFITAAVS
jgi:hypothetical protein